MRLFIILAMALIVVNFSLAAAGEAEVTRINEENITIQGNSYDDIEIGVDADKGGARGSAVIAENAAVNVRHHLSLGIGKDCHGSLLLEKNVSVNVQGDLEMGIGENAGAELTLTGEARLTVDGNLGYDRAAKGDAPGGEIKISLADRSTVKVEGSLVVGGMGTGSAPCQVVQSDDTKMYISRVLLVGHNPEAEGSYTISGGTFYSPRIELSQGGGKATLHVYGSKAKMIRSPLIIFHPGSAVKFTMDEGGVTLLTAQASNYTKSEPLASMLYFYAGTTIDLGFDSPETEAAVAALPENDPGRIFDLAIASYPGYLKWQPEDDFVDHGTKVFFCPQLPEEDIDKWLLRENPEDKKVLQAKYIGK
ncbi:MAG: hypothetical protein JXA52_07715 [Planctomycetes bacterium]|nr:hypothetical protein [Planctomycetota bacterium]